MLGKLPALYSGFYATQSKYKLIIFALFLTYFSWRSLNLARIF